MSPKICARLRNLPELRTSWADDPRRYCSTSEPFGSGANACKSCPRTVVDPMPLTGVPEVHSNGTAAPWTGSHVLMSRDPALSSWVCADQPGAAVLTTPVVGSIGKANKFPVQSWKLSEVTNCDW